MIKRILLIITFSFLLLYSQLVVYARDLTVKIDEKMVSFIDAKPFLDENSRTMVPIRFIAEELGAKVEWDADNRLVKIDSDRDVVLKIDEYMVWIDDGMPLPIDSKPIIKDNRTFVPLRLISEVLNAKVDWDGSSYTVDIKKSVNPREKGNKVVTYKESELTNKPFENIVWSEVATLERTKLNAISSNKEEFVVVGDNGIIKISKDGMAWRQSISNTKENLIDIANNGALFAVLGTNNTLLVSEDLNSWNKINLGYSSTENLVNIIWDGKRFVITSSETIFTSQDGYNWTSSEAKLIDKGYMAYDNNLVYSSGTYIQAEKDRVYLSKDLVHWESVFPAFVGETSGAFYDGVKFVVYGYVYAADYISNGRMVRKDIPFMKESEDGYIWENVNNPDLDNIYKSIKLDQSSAFNDSKMGIAYNSKAFVKINYEHLYKSDDNINWIDVSPFDTGFYNMFWDGKKIVAIQDDLYSFRPGFMMPEIISEDGVTWQKTEIDGSWDEVEVSGDKVITRSNGIYKIKYKGMERTFHVNGTLPLKAKDGYIMTGYISTPVSSTGDNIIGALLKFNADYSYSVLVTVGVDDIEKYRRFIDIASNEVQTVALATLNETDKIRNNAIYTSTDNNKWISTPVEMFPSSVACNGKQFVISGDGSIIVSEDCIDWKKVYEDPDKDAKIEKVVWDGKRYIALVNKVNLDSNYFKESEILYSYDGVIWEKSVQNLKDGLDGIVWNDKFYIVYFNTPGKLLIGRMPE